MLGSNKLLDIPDDAVEKIRKLYDLDKPGRMDDAIDILETWVQKQDHLVKKDFPRSYYERTIILCKGSVEKAKKNIDRLCTMKTLCSYFFSKTNIKRELLEVTKNVWTVPLPKMTNDLYRVVVVRLDAKNILQEEFMMFYQYNIIMDEYLRAHDYTTGFAVIYDCRGTNILDLMTKVNFIHLQEYVVQVLIEGYGARLKSLLILSDSAGVELLVKLCKQLLKPKVAQRIKVCQNIEELKNAHPKHILPKDYDGAERSLKELFEDWIDELSSEEHEKYMKMMNAARTNEGLRQADKFNEEYMGTAGSFRKLILD